MRPVSPSADAAFDARPLIPATLGVRHHSPAGARAVRAMLEAVRPTCILLEAPVDAVSALLDLADRDTVLPVALLAVTLEEPVQRMSLPLSATSPEWIALRWAREHDVRVHGIDLPTGTLLGLDAATLAHDPGAAGAVDDDGDPHLTFARAAGEADFETWWERHVEHQTTDAVAQQLLVEAYATGLRALLPRAALTGLELREAFMRRRILELLAEGHAPERCLVLCGALHARTLTHALAPMDDATLRALPHLDTRVGPIAYSQRRLSSGSGYSAGACAPAYLQLLDAHVTQGTPEALPARFLSELSTSLRARGHAVSAAEVIDAVALAQALAALTGSAVVTFGDLRDAARTCFTRVPPSAFERALEDLAVGTGVGVPGVKSGASPLEWQLRSALQRHGLAHALRDTQQLLRLDLRSTGTAPDGPHVQSRLLHRLHAAGLPFATLQPARGTNAAWTETWLLGWSTGLELALDACAQQADTLDDAARARLRHALCGTKEIEALSDVLFQAAHCGFPDLVTQASEALGSRARHTRAPGPLVAAHRRVSAALRRRPELGDNLQALGAQLLEAAISSVAGLAMQPLPPAGLDALAAELVDVGHLAAVQRERAPAERLDRALLLLGSGREGHAAVRGLGCAQALKRGTLTDQALQRVLSRWLSPGESPERTAAFFEGLLHAQHQTALFEHEPLWRALDAWLVAAPATALLHVLSPLRRVFSSLEPAAHRKLQSTLRRCWRDGPASAPPQPTTSTRALARALEGLDVLELEP